MKRLRSVKKYVESSESEDEKPLKKKPLSNIVINNIKHTNDDSSSESDIENYLLKPEKLDLDSQFFNSNVSEFERVEQNIFHGVTKLSDSDSEGEEEKEEVKSKQEKTAVPIQSHSTTSSKMNFKQMQDYTRQIEEAKKQIDIYKAKKQAGEHKSDIVNLLAAGEKNLGMAQTLQPSDLHSSDFESCDSEKEDWEEIKSKTNEENEDKKLLPQSSLQITVDMPTNVKKKKGVDLLAAMKRRLNRIRKENQLLVHKVHLLCWLAHGNYINSLINDTETLARALSLIPSEQCYPSDRVDLSYLEQIVKWYKRTVKNIEKPVPENITFDKCLQLQISRKEAYNKKMLVYIFIAVLRALGIQTRTVMSLQVEPLRPPQSDLHTVSTKTTEKNPIANKKTKSNSSTDKHSKNQSTVTEQKVFNKSKSITKPHSNKEVDTINFKNKQSEEFKSSNSSTDKHSKNQSTVTQQKVSDKSKSNKKPQSNKQTIHFKNEQSLKRKSDIISKPTSSKRRPNLKNVRDHNTNKDHLKNSKSLDTTNIPESKDSTNSKRSLPKNKKRDIHTIEKNDKTNLNSKSAESKVSVSNVQQTTRKTRSERSEETLKNKTNLNLDCNNIDAKKRSKSTGCKDSVTSLEAVAGTSRSNSIENVSRKRTLRTKTAKGIPQVDGVEDSDSDIDMIILQSDGANDDKKQSKRNTSSRNKSSGRSDKKKSTEKLKESDSDSEFEPTSRSPLTKERLRSSSKINLKKLTVEKPGSSTAKQLDIRNDVMKLVKGRITEQKQKDRSRLSKKGRKDLQSDSDSDYAPEPIKKKFHDSDDDFVPKTKVKRRVQVTSVLSDSDNEAEKNKKKGNDVWVEVFLEAEEKWISVDVIYGQVHCVKEIYQRASHPVSYVVAWNNNNNLKDISQRYCQNFNTVTRKQRVDSNWWSDSLKPFMGTPSVRDKEEDDDLARQQSDQPLPKAISEYKKHPLYALRRHLLKFEALYPPEPATLGFIRGEAVYPRSCVYTLHSRDIWLKQAKVVKLGEQPYKIVKARPKYDRLSNKVITDQELEIFGEWQVQDYEPPTAENGIVPKNAFGNVDLFKACMLPKGCVHLKLPGLNKIARRMNIDVASAIVGFDFHGGWSHPVYDGFVACQEYEDQLICAWELEQDELDRKEEEKIDKRVYGNWKKLIKGLLIRERLKAKYDFGVPTSSNAKDNKNKAKTSKK